MVLMLDVQILQLYVDVLDRFQQVLVLEEFAVLQGQGLVLLGLGEVEEFYLLPD